MGLTGQSFPLTFDFGLGGLDGDGDTLAPDSMSRMGKKGDKEKRLARNRRRSRAAAACRSAPAR